MEKTKYEQAFELVTVFNYLEEIESYIDISKISDQRYKILENRRGWVLLYWKKYDESIIRRLADHKRKSQPNVTSAVDEISLVNKICSSIPRRYPVRVIRKIPKINNENAYEIEWCDARFQKPCSWIMHQPGHEPTRFKDSILSLEETVNIVLNYQNPLAAHKFKVIKYTPDIGSAKVVIEDRIGRQYKFRWSDLLEGKEPTMRSSINLKHNLEIEMKLKNSKLQGKVDIIGWGPKKNTSTARFIEVIYLVYQTRHYIHKNVLMSDEKLTIYSAIDPVNFLSNQIRVENPELANKIKVLKVRLKRKSEVDGYHSQVGFKVHKTGKIHRNRLDYLQTNKHLSVTTGDSNIKPLNAWIKDDPDHLFNFYFIQIIHEESKTRTYKIGYTSYDTMEERVKTMGNKWRLVHTICFTRIKAIEIYHLEKRFKHLCNLNIAKKYRPNGFTELIWTDYLESQWNNLLTKSLSLSETKELLYSA